MVRVLHVIGRMDRAGAETMIMNIYRNINRSKVQFDFLVFSEQEADYDSEIIDMGGCIYRMPKLSLSNYLALYKRFKQFFKTHSYPIVHGHIGSLAPAYLKIAKKSGAYTIAHSHSMKSNRLKSRITYNALAYWVRFIADYFMACSKEAGIDRFGKRIVNTNRFQIINNSIDSKKYQYSQERHEALKEQFNMKGKCVYGHVGRLIRSKNHEFILKVFSNICEMEENAILLLIGKGNLETDISKLAEELGIQEKVIFMGIRSDIPDIMNLMDVFLFPSLFEGFGIVGLEAQAAGLPCFFSDTIPKEAIVTENVFSYPLSWTPVQWAKNIHEIQNSFKRKDERTSIIKAGFDIEATAKGLEDFYLENAKIK